MKTFRILAGALAMPAMLVTTSMTMTLVAQSPLADAARREAARRQAARSAAIPVYTNQDLDKLPARAAPVVPPLPARDTTTVTTAGVGGATVEGAEQAAAAGAAPASARGEEYWRTRITAARSNLSRAIMFAEALQSRINALSTDFTNRDDPAQRQQIFEQRQAALDEMSKVQAEIAAFRQEIGAIEDEARRAGVPAGWLR